MNLIRCLAALASSVLPALVLAGPVRPYDAAACDALTAGGKPVVVAVHASWCPTCRAQKPIQTQLMSSATFKDFTMFVVDFDKDTSVLKRFRVFRQSTIIVFRGKTEVGRSIGDTDPDSIKSLMLRAAS